MLLLAILQGLFVSAALAQSQWPVLTSTNPPQGSQFNNQTLYISYGSTNIVGLVNDASGNPLLTPTARYVGNIGSPNAAPNDGFGFWVGSLALGVDPASGQYAAFGTTWGHGGQSNRPIYKLVSGNGTITDSIFNGQRRTTPDLDPWGGLSYNMVDGKLYGVVNNSQQQSADYLVFRMDLETGVVEKKTVSLPGATGAAQSLMPDLFFDQAGAGYFGAKTNASGTNPWTLYRVDFTQTNWVGEPFINFTGFNSFNFYGAAYLNGSVYLGYSDGNIYKVPFARNLAGINLTTTSAHITDFRAGIETPPGNTPFADGFPLADLASAALAPVPADRMTDLSIVKTGPATVTPNGTLSYKLLVTNNGPSDAYNVIVTDPSATNFTATGVTCTAGGGAGCPATLTIAALQGSGLVIPSLPSGSAVTFTITGTAGADSGTISNQATITVPAGVADSVAANNTSTAVTAISPTCAATGGSQTVYSLDPQATLSAAGAIGTNGGTVNLVYTLTSGDSIPGLGARFTIPLTYSDFHQRFGGSDHTWSKYFAFGPATWDGVNSTPAFCIVPNTQSLYGALPANNTTQETVNGNTDNFFTAYLANGTLDQLGTFDITIGALPALPAGVRLVSDSIRIFSTNNLSTNGNGNDQAGWWVKPIAQGQIFGGNTAQTIPLGVAYGNTYTYKYSAFTDGSTFPGADRGVLIDFGQIVLCKPDSLPPAFACTEATGYLFQNSPTDAYIVNLATGTSTLAKDNLLTAAANNEINGIGYNAKDGYLWGFRQGTNQVARIAGNWNVDTFAVAGIPANALLYIGDVSANGVLYGYTAGTTTIYRVNVNPDTSTYLQTLPALTTTASDIFDWAFSPIDGNLYGFSSSAGYQLYRFNPNTGARTVVGTVSGGGIQVDNPTNTAVFGAAYMDNEGSLYVSSNTNGKIYKIANPHTGGVTAVFVTNGPISGNNDGARCPLAAIPDAPVAINDTATTDAGQPVMIPVLNNDSTETGSAPLDSSSVTVTQQPKHGTVTVDAANGQLTFTPAAGFTGMDTLKYVVKDTAGLPDTASVFINVIPTQPVFSCTSATGYMVQNNPADAYVVDIATGVTTLAKNDLLTGANAALNGLGYNIKDNLLWAARGGTNEIVRIGSDWSVQTFAIAGLPASGAFNVGDISSEGIMYLYATSPATTTIYRVDLNPASPNYLKALPPLTVTATQLSDWVFSPVDGNLYGMDDYNWQLYRINPTTGARTVLGVVSGGGIQGYQAFGAAYTDVAGNLYLGNNTSGRIYKIASPHTGNLTATFFSQGPATTGNDGARCPLAGLPPVAVNDTATTDSGKPVMIPVLNNDSTVVDSIPLDSSSVTITDQPNHGTVTVDSTTGKITYTSAPGYTGKDTLRYLVRDTAGIPDTATVFITIVPAQPVFSCISATGYLFQNDPTDIYIVDLTTGASALVKDNVLGATNATMNSAGFNIKDNHLWAGHNGTNELVRIGSDWSATRFPITGNFPQNGALNVGDISSAGIYYLYASSTTTIYRVDVDPASPGYLKALSPLTTTASDIADWAISPIDNNLYGVGNNLQLYRFNTATGARTVVGNVTGLTGATAFGAVYMDSEGSLYLSDNATGNIYRLPNPHTGNLAAALLTKGPASGNNDGARCPLTLVVSDPPLANTDTTTTPVGTPVTIDVLDNDSAGTYPINPDSIIIVEQPEHGTITIDTTTNTVIYTPEPGYEGQDNFSYIIKDSTGRESSPPATVVVNTTGTPPTGGPAICATPGRDGSTNAGNPVNTYYPAHIGTLSAGSSSVVLDSVPKTDAYGNSFGATPIKAGDLLLIVQMQNATINYENNKKYGSGYTMSGTDTLGGTGYMSLGQTGRYEYVVATNDVALTGGTLTFKGSGAGTGAVSTYIDAAATDARGQSTFQVVRVPQYASLTLDSNIITPPFNGQAGGIIVFDVAGTMNFNGHTVDGSAKGFRGGYSLRQASGVNINSVYVTPSTSADAAKTSGKGEGIAGTPRYMWDGYNQVDYGIEGLPGGAFGKGAPATAGGGGSDHNAGGGGGANGGFGGVGGLGLVFGFGTDTAINYPNGGRPGYRSFLGAAPDITRLVMGSGGGGGDANDATTGTKGGVGGAIILIRAGAVSGNGTVRSNGANGAPGVFGGLPDGAGGGGAGGTVFLNVLNTSPGANITIQANGGNGGNTLGDGDPNPASNVSAHGPGGGGGGGVVWYRLSGGTATAATTPGLAGKSNDGGANSIAHGADTGTVGIVKAFTATDLPAYLQGGGGTGVCPSAAPVVVNDSTTTPINTPVTIPVLANDSSSVPLDSGTVTIVQQPAHGTVTVDSTGKLTYTPDSAYVGKDTLQYTVKDTSGTVSDTAIVIITITPPVADHDNDGIPDLVDIDDDNDGIPDTTEIGPDPNNPRDTDGDGIPDYHDLDSDNDGIPDIIEAGGADPDNDGMGDTTDVNNDGLPDEFDPAQGGTPQPVPDTDKDGIPDVLDIDSDNDGIPDVDEAGIPDTDNNGLADGPDNDGNGWSDPVDSLPVLILPNTDGDAKPDYIDIDADNDGIVDNIEGQSTTGYIPPTGLDSDGDGLDNAYDPTNGLGGAGITPVNTDSTDTPDYIDLDTDNDGKPDTLEGWDTNGNGVIDGAEKKPVDSTDADNDGLLDAYDNDPTTINPTNGTTPQSYPDVNNPGGDRDWREPAGTVPPVAEDDAATTPENTPVTFSLTDNDSSPVGIDSSTVVITQPPVNGTVTVNPDGTVTYTPNPGYTGPDSLKYTVKGKDSLVSNVAIANIAVIPGGPGSAPPVAVNDSTTTPVNTPVIVPVLSNDTAQASRPFDSTSVTITEQPKYGTVAVDSTGKLTYTPNTGYSGKDTLKYTVKDTTGQTTNEATVIITITPVADHDKDGIPDLVDLDDDNDGIPDSVEIGSDPNNPVDTDGDGIPDYHDLDSDNDGIPDIIEAGGTDPDNDGMGEPVDTNQDGLPDEFDPTQGGTPQPVPDTDKDGVPDIHDIDSDNDGITDVKEAGIPDTDNNGLADGPDTDGNGWSDPVDSLPALNLPDTDGDNKPDYLDIDADNDGIVDNIEGQSTTGYIPPTGLDSDGDGLDNAYDPTNGLGGAGITPVNTDSTDTPDYIDLDTDNDGKPDTLEGWDTNGNGVIDGAEKKPVDSTDADNDGLLDAYDNDPTTINPTNGTTPQSYPDMNNPGGDRDWREPAAVDTDKDGIPDITDLDDDNDGIPDSIEVGPDPNNPVDTDGDGIPDYHDLDSDNDGIPDIIEAGGTDTNGDGQVDDPTDKDKNGLPDTYDPAQGGTPLTPLDTDKDGIPNQQDLDSDNDGIPDVVEAGGTDANNDGKPDGPFTDADKDGFIDTIDPVNNTPTGGTPLVVTGPDNNADGKPDSYPAGDDLDRDGVPNLWDIDSDNDGITDVKEAGIPDTDNNGLADGTDADKNGWSDPVDNLPALNLPNSDGNGEPDYLDIDADNDGIVDNIEGQSTTAYIPPTGMDSDGDGLDNAYDPTNGPGGAGVTPVNTDNTDQPDYTDLDTDNDGKPDSLEGWDTNGNGVIDGAEKKPGTADADKDGLLDGYDADPTKINPANGTTPASYPDVNNPGNDRDWREKQGPVADLVVTVTLQTTSAIRTGDFITYTVEVLNKGPQGATGVLVSNILPTMLNTPKDIQVPRGIATYDPVTRTIIWQLGELALNETQVLTFTTRVLSNGSLTDSAVVSGNETDPVMVNNEDVAPAVTIGGEELFIPNTFTPNGDGRNDRFIIKGLERYTNVRIEIYNRWGNQVYRSDNYSNNWDGSDLNQGIYYYVLKVRGTTGAEKEYQGWLQLLR